MSTRTCLIKKLFFSTSILPTVTHQYFSVAMTSSLKHFISILTFFSSAVGLKCWHTLCFYIDHVIVQPLAKCTFDSLQLEPGDDLSRCRFRYFSITPGTSNN